MSAKATRITRWALTLVISVSSAGCVAAAAAGAAGAVYGTTRGVESLVNGSTETVAARAQAVMTEMGIIQEGSSTDDGGAKREFKGKQGDLDVSIKLQEQDATTTKVEVFARKNLAEWDKDYAREILERIVKRS